MIRKKQLVAFAMLVSIIIAAAPASAILLGQDQIQATPAEELVEVADKAEQQVENLIDLVYASETNLQIIEDAGLIEELEGNVTLYDEGGENLTAAHNALEIGDYEEAAEYATEALCVFREVFSSIHVILEAAGLQKGHLVDYQGLLEAITRQLQKIDWLRDILSDDASEEIWQLLDDAEALLDVDASRALLLEGEETEVRDNLQDANQLISQVFQYLKQQAEASNTWRIANYCDGVQNRIQERFRQGNQTEIDFTAVLESLGYQSENQFMETLQNMIYAVKGKAGDLKNALQDLEAIGQMVQEMDQALMQEIQRHQGGNGSAGGDGSGSNGSGKASSGESGS